MNKFLCIGEISFIERIDKVATLIVRTAEANQTGQVFTVSPPPIKVMGAALEKMPPIEKGNIVLVKGHYQRKLYESTWYHEIIAYQVTTNLHFNLFLGTGNLGGNAQLTPQKKALTFSLACKRYYKGEKLTDWVRSVLFTAKDGVQHMLLKGRELFVAGSLQYESYEPEDGSGKRYNTSLAVRDWQVYSVRSRGN